MRHRRTEVTVELDRTTVIRGRREPAAAWCAACSARVTMLTAEEAAAVSSLSTRAIYRLIEAGRLHFAEPPGSPLLVCFNSLRRR